MEKSTITRRSLLALMGASGASLALAACGSDNDAGGGGNQTARFTWWGNPEVHERMQAFVDAYMVDNPDLTFVTETAGFGDYFDKLSTQLAAGTGPDVMLMSSQLLIDYSKRGGLYDLGDYVDDPIDTTTWDPVVVNAGVVDGVRTGIPITTDSYAVMYDVEVMDSIGIELPRDGWTWDDLADIAAETSAALGDGKWGVDDGSWFHYYQFEVWVRSRGGALFATDGEQTKLGFENVDLEEWFEYWQRLRDNGSAVPIEVTVEGTGHETRPLVRGLAPIYWSVTSGLAGVRSMMPTPVDVVPVPDVANAVRAGNMIRPNLFLSMAASTRLADQMADFIATYTNDAEAAEIVGNVHGVPVNPESARIADEKDGDLGGVRSASEYLELIAEIGSPMDLITPKGGRDVYEVLKRMAEEVAFGRLTIVEATNQFVTESERLLA